MRTSSAARRMAAILLTLAIGLSAGCWESRPPEGVVGEVNGEPIHIRSIQAWLDGILPDLEAEGPPTLEDFRRGYGDAVAALVVQALARQDLERRGIGDLDGRVAAMEAALLEDYGKESLEEILADFAISPEDWRHLARGRAAVLALDELVLRPGIRVSQEDVVAFYEAGRDGFLLPERYVVCLASSASAEAMTAWRGEFASGDGRSSDADVKVLCSEMPVADAPEAWRRELASMKPGSSATPRTEDGLLRSMGLSERRPAERLGPAAAYAVIEKEIVRRRLPAAFDAWLAEALAGSTVTLAPSLRADLAGRRTSRGTDAPPAGAADAAAAPSAQDAPETGRTADGR